jgi:transposase-like protein DUF772/DDE family transposase
VRMHLAYRWFTRLGFEQEIPDHSTFSKNRHGRFRQSGVFREVFEEIVRRCLEAGLVEGQNLAVDGTIVGANASRQSRVPREQLQEVAQLSRTVRGYLAELEQVNPVSDAKMISTTDPDAIWTTKGSGTAMMAYYDNYLIDTASRVIVEVEATPALSRQEMVAARRMTERVEKLGLRPESLGADKAYGSGEFLAWLLARGVQPHIPVIDRRHQTGGRFTRDQFRYEPSTTARKESRCGIAASIAPSAVLPIVRLPPSAKDVRRKHSVRPLPIAHFSFTWMNPPDKWHGPWRAHLLTNVREELATRSRLYLLNLSSA